MNSTTQQGTETPKTAPLKAIQAGGPTGGIYPPEMIESIGLGQGSGSPDEGSDLMVLGEGDCVVSHVREDLLAFLETGPNLCPACDRKLKEAAAALNLITRGEGGQEILDKLRASCEQVESSDHCQAARQAVNPILTSFRFFRAEYEMHVLNRHCPAKVCAALLPAPCQIACPAGIDIPSYLALVAQGKYEEALEVIREENPLPWVCGLICPHPCEKACVRSKLDLPLNIRYLKAFVAEWVDRQSRYPVPMVPPPTDRKVAVIGSGPAGITCAHYLAMKGHSVTVFESLPIPGGLLMFGIPEYRLSRSIVQKEIDSLRSMGVLFKTGVSIGKDISLDDLRGEGFEAFFLGIGAHRGFKLGIEGEDDFPQMHDAISFLRQVGLGGREKPAEKVIVVGGGNSAMDAARTCIRLGCKEVHVVYRRTRAEMPANPHEIQEAVDEGVQLHFLAVPVRIGGTGGKIEYLECLQAELGQPDASGRRTPIPVADSNFRIEAGAVIAAIGQEPDFNGFEQIPVEINRRNLIVTDRLTCRTSARDVFAGGDAVTGPATVVQAIAAGKQAAIDIENLLAEAREPLAIFSVSKKPRVTFSTVSATEKITSPRMTPPLVEPEVRSRTFEPVELSLSEEEARREAARCLRCDVCIRCGTCERVCREEVKVEALEFKAISPPERILSNYERPGERCVTCGACALACPTQAIQIVDTPDGTREMRLCGTVLNSLQMVPCSSCGKPSVPQRYLDYVVANSGDKAHEFKGEHICSCCARAKRAEALAGPDFPQSSKA